LLDSLLQERVKSEPELDMWWVIFYPFVITEVFGVTESSYSYADSVIMDFKRIVVKHGEEISLYLTSKIPDSIRDLDLCHLDEILSSQQNLRDLVIFLCITLGTLAGINLLTRCLSQKSLEIPLLKKIAEVDRKLFVSNAIFSILRRELVETQEASKKEVEQITQLRLQHITLQKELTASKEEFHVKEEQLQLVSERLEGQREIISVMQQNINENKQKFSELTASNTSDLQKLKEKELLISQLHEQVEMQESLITNTELQMKKKMDEKEKLSEEVGKAQQRVTEIKLSYEVVCKELYESNAAAYKLKNEIHEMEVKEDSLKVNSESLQSELHAKSEECDLLESEVLFLKSKILEFESDYEKKESEIEILKEALEVELNDKNYEVAEADGWDVDQDCLLGIQLEEVKEQAKVKMKLRKYAEENECLRIQLENLKVDFDEIKVKSDEVDTELKNLRLGREKAIESKVDAERKLTILNEYFTKKEEELRTKLIQETSKNKDISSDAEVATRKLVSVIGELEQTKIQLNMLTEELEEQETSLKLACFEAERKSEENWIAARKAERRASELQKEMSSMRNQLTLIEGNKETSMKNASNSLPPLPGLPPSMPLLPGMPMALPPLAAGVVPGPTPHETSFRDALSNISFVSRRTQSMSSLSPYESKEIPDQFQGVYDQYSNRSDQYKSISGRYEKCTSNTISRSPFSPEPERSSGSEMWRNSTAKKVTLPLDTSISYNGQYNPKEQDQHKKSEVYSQAGTPPSMLNLSFHQPRCSDHSDASLAYPGYKYRGSQSNKGKTSVV